MNKRFQARFGALMLLLAAILLTSAQVGQRVTATTGASPAASASSQLAALPASDFIIFVDTQRLVADTLPNFLAGDQALLSKVNAKLDRFQKECGVDPRSFDSLAIGLRFPATGTGHDMRFAAIAHGRFVASDLIEAGFATAKTRENIGREEQVYEGKKIFVLTSARDRAAAEDGPTAKTERADARRMAVAELDGSTIVMGDLESVRATLNQSMARVDQGLVDLATRNSNAVASFAGNLPPSLARGFGFGNGKAAKLASSVRQVYGSASTAGTEAQTLVAARTENAEQAQDIAQAINGLKLLSKFGIGGRGSSKAQAEALSSLLNNLTITSQGNEVEFKLNVTQQEIAPLMRNF
ncbi:MAG TPA: hypothetical protein VF544_19920 [Pyrinomonadaceae bacterium]|jgi:hypothetical protein